MLTFEIKSISLRLTLYLRNMRLRLSKRFYAALMAAIASVTFTFSVQQAAAAEQVEASASSETETAMAVEASEAQEFEGGLAEEENREPDSAPAVSVGFNGIIGSSDAFDFLGGSENVGNLDSASQQQAGAQSASSSASLPSNELGFTANAYADSIAEALEDVAAPSVPAAIASELKLTTPAKSTSSGSSSSSSDDYSSVADASTVSGSAWNASYGSHISAPAFRSLSSKAPGNFAAANGTGSSLVIASPAGDSVPLLGADEQTWIFYFDNGVGPEPEYFYKEQDAYEFKVDAGKTGVIKFNNLKSELEVKGEFKMIGENFTIDTNGVAITFDQPMSNYDTEFTVQDSSADKSGKIIANGPAAFKSLYVESGEMVVNAQIGVTNQLKIGGAAATLTLNEDAKMILTQQVECDGGTINLYGTVDASNLPPAVAAAIGIHFVGLDGKEKDPDGKPYTSGFLGAGTWNLGKDGSKATNIDVGGKAKLLVASSDFQILSTPDNRMPHVSLGQTDKRIWFQNGGVLDSFAEVAGKSEDGQFVSLLLSRTQESAIVEVNVDEQIHNDNVLYVTAGTQALVHLGWGSVGNVVLMSGSTTSMTPTPNAEFEGWPQINMITFIGENVKLQCNEDFAEDFPEYHQISPYGITVQAASDAILAADYQSYFGYYIGQGYGTSDPTIHKSTGNTLLGRLTIADGYTFDLRNPDSWTIDDWGMLRGIPWAPNIGGYDSINDETTLIYEEIVTRLVMSDEGSLVLQDDATFKASTVTNNSLLTEDGTNLDTKRILKVKGEITDTTGLEGLWTQEMDEQKVQVNGTMELTDNATLTALNGKVGEDVVNNYTTRNQNFRISGGKVTVTDEDDRETRTSPATTLSNELSGSSVINAKAKSNGSLTLDNTKARGVDLNLVHAQEGDIIITHKDEVTADTVQIAAKRMVAAVKAESFTLEATNATLTVDTLLQAEGGPTESSNGTASKVKADVVLLEGATLDVSNALGKGGLDLAGSFTIQSGAMLSDDDMLAVGAMEIGDKYDLAFNVTSFNERMDELSMDLQNAIDASDLFGGQFGKGEYYVCYTGSGSQGQSTGNGSNVGTVYLYKATPEPTTGTLSLLALAALAARRRRKG